MVLGLPLIFIHLLGLPNDIYYLIFMICAVAFLRLYQKKSDLNIKSSLNSGWALGSILGLFFGLGFVSYYLTISASLPEYNVNIAAIIWRGLFFGFFSGVMLSAFPFVTIWRAFAGDKPGKLRRIGVVAISAAAVFLMSASHTVGTIGIDRDKIEKQIKADIIASLPTLLSGNPIASPVTKSILKVSETVFTDNEINDSNNDINTAILDKEAGGNN